MYKRLRLQIDSTSWAAAPRWCRKPCPFPSGQNEARINFLRALLWIGLTSVPIRMPRWWLASQWAQLRYLAAADHQITALRLHDAVRDLERHHKQVLSDDWGVGLALEWLCSRLRYSYLQHSSFVLADLERNGLATLAKQSKNGAAKCPDFIALDPEGRFHLIECKGNQKGPREILNQFRNGRLQKQNIWFRRESLVGQRLLTGVAIAAATSNWESTFRLEDPPPKNEDPDGMHEISAESATPIMESLRKATVLSGLLSAGAYGLAHRAFPIETETAEVVPLPDTGLTDFLAGDAVWRGREYDLFYPVPLKVHRGSAIRGARMRFGVSRDLVSRAADVQNQKRLRALLLQSELELLRDDLVTRASRELEGIERHTSIRLGNTFIAEMDLL